MEPLDPWVISSRDLTAPRYNLYYPKDLWNEILPGLTLGGTADEDVFFEGNDGGRFEDQAFIIT